MSVDIFKSIKGAIYERTTSPLIGTFIVSWIIWNYKFFVVLLSSMAAPEKLSYIECTLYPDWKSFLCVGALGPLITALLFLFIYPYPARFVFRFWHQRQKELKEIRQQIENETPLTTEESRKIRRELVEQQLDYDSQLQRNSSQIEQLKKNITERDESIAVLEKELANTKALLTTHNSNPREYTEVEITTALLKTPYRLVFNPSKGTDGTKLMLFGRDGQILEGKNHNEHTWRVRDGKLELMQEDGKLHSRFHFDLPTNRFIHTNDTDTRSTRNQYLVPAPAAAQ